MPRKARIVLPGYPHHITQRGNRRNPVFFSHNDRILYLQLARKYFEDHGVSVLAYCLMPNHVHFAAVPEREDSFHLSFKLLARNYARTINKRNEWCGHFWQERYFSSILDEESLCPVVRYIELNPVRAKLASHAEEYPYSSAKAHCKNQSDPILSITGEWKTFLNFSIRDWSEWLTAGTEKPEEEKIREYIARNLPLVSEKLTTTLEVNYNQCLRIKPPGRPRTLKP